MSEAFEEIRVNRGELSRIKGVLKELNSAVQTLAEDIFKFQTKVTEAIKILDNLVPSEIEAALPKIGVQEPATLTEERPAQPAPAEEQVKAPRPVEASGAGGEPEPTVSETTTVKPTVTISRDAASLLDELMDMVRSGVPARKISEELGVKRDELADLTSFSPCFYEMANWMRRLKPYEEGKKLTKQDEEELLDKILEWKYRMRS